MSNIQQVDGFLCQVSPRENTTVYKHLVTHPLSFLIPHLLYLQVEEIRRTLEANNLVCWVDSGAHMRGHSSISSRSTAGITSSKIQSESSHMDNNSQRGMKSCSALICCITPKYLQSENCITDLKLADSLNKPVIAILLRFSSWPPEGSPPSVKRLLSKCTEVIEMYNDKLYRQNMTQLVDRTSRVLSGS